MDGMALMEPLTILILLVAFGAGLAGYFIAQMLIPRRVESPSSQRDTDDAQADARRPLHSLPTHLVEITETRKLLHATAETIHQSRAFPLVTVYPYGPA